MFKSKKPSVKGGPHIFITTAKAGTIYTNGSYAIDLTYVRNLPPEFQLAVHKAEAAGEDHSYQGYMGEEPSTSPIAFQQLWETQEPETEIKPSYNVVMGRLGDPHRRSFTELVDPTDDGDGDKTDRLEVRHRVYLSEPFLQNIASLLGKLFSLEDLTFKQPAGNNLAPVRIYAKSGEQIALIMPLQVKSR